MPARDFSSAGSSSGCTAKTEIIMYRVTALRAS